MKIVFLLITLLAATQAREDLVQQLTARAKNHLSARTAAAEVLEDNIRPRHDGNHIPAGLPDDIAEELNEIGQLLANNDKEKDGGSGDDEANFLPDKPEKPAKAAKKQGKGSKKAGKGSKKTSDEAASDRFIADRAPPQHEEEPERATGELGPADLEAIPASLRRYIQDLEDREQVRKREEKEKAAATAEIRSLLLGLTRKRQQ